MNYYDIMILEMLEAKKKIHIYNITSTEITEMEIPHIHKKHN